mmetsp:Transcript_28184/g.76232  ORF Transcript_28184/g.76232 Transcript_28184/m.76232 type:complete len:357 (+) Transcript_28184:496-1566(+)
MVASFRMICAFACRMCPCFSLMRSSILASSACSETSDDAVAASSSASSFDRRRRSCRHVSSSLPIDSRSSCTYSRQRPSGLDAWQRVWIVVRSVVISFLLGSLTDEPVFAPFLPRMMPPSPSSSPIGSVPSSSPGCSISALASSRLRTSLPWPSPVGSISMPACSPGPSIWLSTITIVSSSSCSAPSMMTPAAAAGAPIGFSTLTSFVFSLGGARRADFGRTRPLGSSAAGGSSSGFFIGADANAIGCWSGAGSGAPAGAARSGAAKTGGSGCAGGRSTGGIGGGGGAASCGGGSDASTSCTAALLCSSLQVVAAWKRSCRKALVFSGSMPATTLPARMAICEFRAISTHLMILER